MKYFLIYTGLRIALFAACWAIVGGVASVIFGASPEVGAGSLAVGALLSLVLSYPLLAGPRERFALSVQQRAERATARFNEIKTSEDAD